MLIQKSEHNLAWNWYIANLLILFYYNTTASRVISNLETAANFDDTTQLRVIFLQRRQWVLIPVTEREIWHNLEHEACFISQQGLVFFFTETF